MGVFPIPGFSGQSLIKKNWHNSRTSDDMKLGPVNKLDKKIWRRRHAVNCDVIVIFPIYSLFGAIQKLDFGRIFCKTYIFINSNLLSYKNWKQNLKISGTALTLLLWVKVLFLQKKKMLLFCKKNADISKIKRTLVLKGKFSETTYVCILTYQIPRN